MDPRDSLIIDFLTGNLDINPLENNVRSSVVNAEITHVALVVLGIEAFENVNIMFALSFMLEHSSFARVSIQVNRSQSENKH